MGAAEDEGADNSTLKLNEAGGEAVAEGEAEDQGHHAAHGHERAAAGEEADG